jgi:predicted alpha/beta superfamily hydrolase
MFCLCSAQLLALYYSGRLLDHCFYIQSDENIKYPEGGMKKLLCAFVFLELFSIVSAQEIKCSFVLYAPGLADTSSVFISGSLNQLGNWNPSRVKMEFVGSQMWKKEIVVEQVVSVEYKYTLGSWDREGVNTMGLPLPNFSVTLAQGMSVIDTIRLWKNGSSRRINGQVTGTVKYHRAVKGVGIKERDIIVWLPPGYDPSAKKRYPVMYMQDGQNVFDPVTSAFGTDWEIDETADSMIRRGSITPLIIVGVYNTAERNVEYIPTDKGKLYREFLAFTLKPFIDSTYKTKQGKKYNFIGGSSAGGILAFMMDWEYPGLYSKAICMSPAFRLPGSSQMGWNYVSTVKEDTRRKKVFFYIDNGGIALEQKLQPGVDEMLKALTDKVIRQEEILCCFRPTAKHSEEAWHSRFPYALKLVTRQAVNS